MVNRSDARTETREEFEARLLRQSDEADQNAGAPAPELRTMCRPDPTAPTGRSCLQMSSTWRRCEVCKEATIQKQKRADEYGAQYRYWCHRGHWADPES